MALDISTKTGWAVFNTAQLVKFGLLEGKKLADFKSKLYEYPHNYMAVAQDMARKIHDLVREIKPDIIVIEETNKGKNSFSQKTLEWIHYCSLQRLVQTSNDHIPEIYYIRSSMWRKTLEISMSKEDKKQNLKLSKAKSVHGDKLDKKKLGIRGKITKKHLALRYVNETFELDLKVKDNDIADAICLGQAYNQGATICDGSFGKKRGLNVED